MCVFDFTDPFARKVRADEFVEAFEECFEEGVGDLSAKHPCLFYFQPFNYLMLGQFLLVLRSYALLEGDVIVKLLSTGVPFIFAHQG